jgi:glucosylceramidase
MLFGWASRDTWQRTVRNPDGSYVVEAFNPFPEEKDLIVELEGERLSFTLAGESFNSMILQK